MNKLKILLLAPPLFDFYFTPARREPLGLLYLKQALNNANFNCDIYDATLRGKIKAIALPLEFHYLKKFYFHDDSFFALLNKYYRFGDSIPKIVNQIISKQYNLIAISALFSAYYPDVEEIISSIKFKTNALVAVGGWAVQAEKNKLFEQSNADFFIYDDGFKNLPLLATGLQNNLDFKNIPGLFYKSSGKTCTNRPSNESTLPEYYPIRNNFYYFQKKKIASVIISRGCPYKCEFCTIHREGRFSIRSLQSIENELKYLLTQGYQIINFEDDNLFFTKSFSIKFLELLKKYHRKGLSYTAMNGITTHNIEAYIDQIIEAGFIEFNLSLVTADINQARKSKRPFTRKIFKKVIAKINGRIKTLAFLILGLPGTNPQMVLNDIIWLASLPVTIGVSPLYLLPEVPALSKLGIPTKHRLLRGSALYKFPPLFSRVDIASIWKFTIMLNKIKNFPVNLSEIEKENIKYFKKSLREKKWYRLNKKGSWEATFNFSIIFPENFKILKHNGEKINFTDL